MLTAFIVLAALSFVATMGGALWLLLSWDSDSKGPVSNRGNPAPARRTKAAESQRRRLRYREVTGSYAELKQLVRSGRWRRALPALLAIFSLLATTLFTALALFVGLDDRFFGGFVLAVALFAIVAILIGFIRA